MITIHEFELFGKKLCHPVECDIDRSRWVWMSIHYQNRILLWNFPCPFHLEYPFFDTLCTTFTAIHLLSLCGCIIVDLYIFLCSSMLIFSFRNEYFYNNNYYINFKKQRYPGFPESMLIILLLCGMIWI